MYLGHIPRWIVSRTGDHSVFTIRKEEKERGVFGRYSEHRKKKMDGGRGKDSSRFKSQF